MARDIVEKLNEAVFKIAGYELEIPADLNFGDFTMTAAMKVAKQIKRSPLEIAAVWQDKLAADSYIKKYVTVTVLAPGFVNIKFKYSDIAPELIELINRDDYGRLKIGQGKTVVVEYSSPNTNKPLHLGHLRNDALGMALAKIFSYLGYRVKKVSIINDRGIHIMQSLLAYMKWGNNDTPSKAKKKGDHFVGDYYVKYNQAKDDNLEKEVSQLLQKWEDGDSQVKKIWQQMNDWVYQGWRQTYQRYGSQFDKQYYESQLYDKGREIVKDQLAKGLVYKNDKGALVINLGQYNLGGRESGEKVLLRPDNTTVYTTQDIYLAKQRYQEYKFAKMFYVVADEQNYHFQALFKILELFGFSWVDRCYHYSYGMIDLPSGKMKSREGTVVDADDLLNELAELAKQEIGKRRDDLKKDEAEDIAEKVALAAVKYWFLKSNPKSRILFDPQESLDFEGNTGPYLLYTYVRLQSILRKAGQIKKMKKTGYQLLPQETRLIAEMLWWQFVLKDFNRHYNVNVICEYLYKLAGSLNSYYQSVPVLKAEGEIRDMRLQIVAAGSKILKTGLGLLNIDTLERM